MHRRRTALLPLLSVLIHYIHARSCLTAVQVLRLRFKFLPIAAAYLLLTAKKNVDILSEDTVKIKKSELCLELISLRKRNFFKLLNEKLKEREM